jgi:nitrous oxidase accessory protein
VSEEVQSTGRWLRCSRGGAVLALYAAGLIAASMLFTWWRMECRAPQYGHRVLVVDISPTSMTGDVKEINGLGHFVGMMPLERFAPFERAAAPYGLALAAAAALLLLFLRPGWLRRVVVAAVFLIPAVFIVDLWAWQQYAVTNLDPKASLNLIQNRIQARVFGEYAVAQFKVHAIFGTGFWLVAVASLNALGFAIVEWRKRTVAGRAVKELAAAAALAALLCPASAPARTLEVGPGRPYRTIGAAIAAARPGDEVRVRAGLYRERVRIDRPLSLSGEEGAVIDGGGRGTVIKVESGPCAIRGLEVRGSGDSLFSEDSGIKLTRAPGCAIEGNRLDDALFGILANYSPRAVVRGNRVRGKEIPVPRRGDGIRIYHSHHSIVEENFLERGRDLAIWQSNDIDVRHNRVRTSRYGLHYMYCDRSVFEDNVFEDNQVGGAIMYSRGLTLRRNRFLRSRGPSALGLLLKTGDDVLAESNHFLDNTTGLFFEETPSSMRSSCVIRGNVIAGNDVGISLQPAVARVVFTENAFVANRTHVEVLGRTERSKNAWSAGGRGNYWSDYVGFDADGDGVGDTPHKVEHYFEDLAARWPAVGLLRMGPAALALDLAARAFPVVSPVPTAVDDHPLIGLPASLGPAPARPARMELALGGLLVALASLAAVGLARRPAGRESA